MFQSIRLPQPMQHFPRTLNNDNLLMESPQTPTDVWLLLSLRLPATHLHFLFTQILSVSLYIREFLHVLISGNLTIPIFNKKLGRLTETVAAENSCSRSQPRFKGKTVSFGTGLLLCLILQVRNKLAACITVCKHDFIENILHSAYLIVTSEYSWK